MAGANKAPHLKQITGVTGKTLINNNNFSGGHPKLPRYIQMTKNITLFFNDKDCNIYDVKSMTFTVSLKQLKSWCKNNRLFVNGTLYKVGHFELYSTNSSYSSYGSNGCINLFPLDYDFIR